MARQCEFADEGLFEDALKAFYAEVAKLTVMNPSFGYPYPAGPKDTAPEGKWGSLYMENELNIQQPGSTLVSELKPDMLAISGPPGISLSDSLPAPDPPTESTTSVVHASGRRHGGHTAVRLLKSPNTKTTGVVALSRCSGVCLGRKQTCREGGVGEVKRSTRLLPSARTPFPQRAQKKLLPSDSSS